MGGKRTRYRWLTTLERETERKNGRERDAEGRFGTAMNISLAHLFMQYFALAALRRFPLSMANAANRVARFLFYFE